MMLIKFDVDFFYKALHLCINATPILPLIMPDDLSISMQIRISISKIIQFLIPVMTDL